MGSDLASNLRTHMRTYTQGRRNYTRMGEGEEEKRKRYFEGFGFLFRSVSTAAGWLVQKMKQREVSGFRNEPTAEF